MKVLVDTCIWSLVLRSNATKNTTITNDLIELINELRVQIIGPIRQELLSGIKITEQFQQLKKYLRFFPDISLETEDFEKAAEFYNICRKNGVQGSNTDFLICAAAHNHNLSIFTTDKDFNNFAKYLPISFYHTRL